jgi:uncharacterized delta-60 repeat protein
MRIKKIIFPIILAIFLISVPISISIGINIQEESIQDEKIFPYWTLNNEASNLENAWGGTENDIAHDVAVDSSGNIYITGETESYGAGNYDAFLAKYTSSGSFLWNVTFGQAVPDEKAHGIAIDSSDNIYITGIYSFSGAISPDAFIVKYNSSGAIKWAKYWSGTPLNYEDRAFDIAIDETTDSVYIIGDTESNGIGNTDAFIANFSISSGDLQGNKTWGGTGGDYGRGITVDGSGNIYISGYTTSGLSYSDAFLVKYDNLGVEQWNETWGGSASETCNDIALDNSGDIYITGYTTSFGVSFTDVFFVKYDSSGNQQGNETWGGGKDDVGNAITVDSSGNIYITGETISYGAGGFDAFILKYDDSRTLQWNKYWGGDDTDDGNGIALSNSEDIYITGETQSFGAGGSDAFLAKYSTSGSLSWSSPTMSSSGGGLGGLLPLLLSGGETEQISGFVTIPLIAAISFSLILIIQKARKKAI